MKDGNFVASRNCFICGESANIILDKRMKDISHLNGTTDIHCICSDCLEKAKEHVCLIERKEPDPGKETLTENEVYNSTRTGRIVWIKREAVQRIFGRVYDSPFAFCDDKLFDILGIKFEGEGKEDAEIN